MIDRSVVWQYLVMSLMLKYNTKTKFKFNFTRFKILFQAFDLTTPNNLLIFLNRKVILSILNIARICVQNWRTRRLSFPKAIS